MSLWQKSNRMPTPKSKKRKLQKRWRRHASPGETPQPANTEKPKKPRHDRSPKEEKTTTENQKAKKSAGFRRNSRSDAQTQKLRQNRIPKKFSNSVRPYEMRQVLERFSQSPALHK